VLQAVPLINRLLRKEVQAHIVSIDFQLWPLVTLLLSGFVHFKPSVAVSFVLHFNCVTGTDGLKCTKPFSSIVTRGHNWKSVDTICACTSCLNDLYTIKSAMWHLVAFAVPAPTYFTSDRTTNNLYYKHETADQKFVAESISDRNVVLVKM